MTNLFKYFYITYCSFILQVFSTNYNVFSSSTFILMRGRENDVAIYTISIIIYLKKNGKLTRINETQMNKLVAKRGNASHAWQGIASLTALHVLKSIRHFVSVRTKNKNYGFCKAEVKNPEFIWGGSKPWIPSKSVVFTLMFYIPCSVLGSNDIAPIAAIWITFFLYVIKFKAY